MTEKINEEEMDEIARKLMKRGFLVDQDKWRLLMEIEKYQSYLEDVRDRYDDWKDSESFREAKKRHLKRKRGNMENEEVIIVGQEGEGNGNGR